MKKLIITITLIATMAVAAKRVRALELKIDELDTRVTSLEFTQK